MKKVTHIRNRQAQGGGYFWQPWGCLGCLGRIIAFLIILALVMWLLNLLHGCNRGGGGGGFDPDRQLTDPDNPDIEKIDSIGNNDPLPKVPVDTTVSDWRKDIPDPGPNLPAPGDNYLPPVADDDIITGDDGRQMASNRLNVILDSDANDATFRRWAQEFKQLYPGDEYSVVYYDPNTKLLQIQVPPSQRERMMTELPRQITDISFKVFPEGLLGPEAARPNDPVFNYPELSWYFDPIQTYEAWEITEGSPEVKVAVVDSYFDLSHDDLNSKRIFAPYSVRRRTGNVAPEAGCDEISLIHGSMVASQALGNKGNARGTAGIAPGCTFIPVSMGHQFTTMSMLSGVLYAIYKGASVINISAGAVFGEDVSRIPVGDQVEISRGMGLAEQDVWDYVTDLADKRNVTLVWAAGNEDVLTTLDPSKRRDSAIRVSAVDERLAKADFSNFGNLSEYNVESSTVSAPGVNIFGARPYNSYTMGPGTSFSAPIVTGAVALMKSLDPTLTNREIIEILQETGRKPSDGCTTIGPVIQIRDALLKVKSNFARYDDLIKDRSRLKGLWQSTELQTAINKNGPTGEKLWLYYEFDSPVHGKSTIYETGSKTDFVTDVQVNWSDSSLSWKTGQYLAPTRPNGYVAVSVECKPDENGLMQCVQTSAEYGTTKYYLKRIKSRNKEQ